MIPVFVLFLGLIIGSFIGAFTYRIERGASISKGRSKCVSCKQKIAWFDNIPVLSFFLLKGKCRKCKKKISIRYPIIEALTALLLFGIYLQISTKDNLIYASTLFPQWKHLMGFLFWPFILFILIIFISIFVIDLEKMIIPDELVFSGLVITAVVFLISKHPYFLKNLFTGFIASLFLLLLHIITKGKGMGLGDVKLAILGGLLLGARLTMVWIFLSFIIGAIVGLALILFKKAKLKQQVPFGPFLIFSLFVVLFFGETILKMILFI